MLELASKKNCETAMVYNYRFFDQTRAAKEAIANRNFGEVISATALVHYACWPHCLDLLSYFAGDVVEVSGTAGTLEHTSTSSGISACDVSASLRLENGGCAAVVATAGLDWKFPLYELTFNLERGRIHLRDLEGNLEILDSANGRHEVLSISRDSSRWEGYGASFKKAMGAYLDSIRKDEAPPVAGIAGLKQLQFEAALKRSIAEKRPVDIQSEFPLTS